MIIFMRESIFQMFITGTGEYLNELLSIGLGGVILFSKDISSEEILRKTVENIKSEAKVSPFISVDQEGGRVERTEAIRPKRLSAKFAYERGTDFLKAQSEEISKELSDWGFNLNFAPCIDVNTNPDNPIIGERAFSDNPDDVIKGAGIYTDAMRKNGIIPCVKHYPGHGDADRDSHLTLPCIDLPLKDMENTHIKPFNWAVKNNIEMIMAAHLHCTCFDREIIPSSLSRNAIGYLRNTLNYDGVVISDDMVMKGVQDYGSIEACIMGIRAGLDMFIFRNADKETFETISKLAEIISGDVELTNSVKKSNERILKLKQKAGLLK